MIPGKFHEPLMDTWLRGAILKLPRAIWLCHKNVEGRVPPPQISSRVSFTRRFASPGSALPLVFFITTPTMKLIAFSFPAL